MSPHRIFLTLAIVGGLPIVFLTPPFQVPDEPAHFYRAYQIAEGRLIAVREAAMPGGFIPRALTELTGPFETLAHRRDHRTSLAQIAAARRISIRTADRQFVPFPGSAVYLPLAYAPQAVGMLVSRAFTNSALDHMYAGRLGNFVVAVGILYVAIRMAPFFGWTIALLALMPMSLFLRSSLSPDAMIIAVAFLTFALALRALALQSRLWPKLGIAAGILSLMKPYGVIAFLGLANRRTFRSPAAVALVLLVIACTVALAWFGSSYFVPPQPSVSPDRQIQHIAGNPVGFPRAVIDDLMAHAHRYGQAMIGVLGWLDTELPHPFTIGYAAILCLVAFCDGPATGLSFAVRAAAAIIAIIMTITVELSLYLTWTPAGWSSIHGV